MANYYSNHFAPRSSASVPPPTSVANVRIKMETGINRVPLVGSRATLDFSGVALASIAIGDQWRLLTLKSSDRIWEISGWWDAGGALPWTGTLVNFELGLYAPGANHDGVLVDTNNYATAANLLVDAVRLNLMTSAGTTDEDMRGLQIWETLNEAGVTSYPRDPQLEYDLTATVTNTTGLSAAGRVVIETIFSPAGK